MDEELGNARDKRQDFGLAAASPRERPRGLHCGELQHGELARHLAQRRPDPGREAPSNMLEIQAAHDELWYGRAPEEKPAWLEAGLRGADRHLDTYGHSVDWEHPATVAAGTPLAPLHRHRRWQHHLQCAEEVGEEAASQWGGGSLVRFAQAAAAEDLLLVAPRLEVGCLEAPKEEVLRAAVHVGRAARSLGDTEKAEQLQATALAMISSVASRARDAHNVEFLVQTLEAMPEAGVGALLFVDMLLAALYAQLARNPLSAELARRTARAVRWAAASLPSHDGSSELGAASRRAVATVARVLREGGDEDAAEGLDAIAEVASSRLRPGKAASGYCPQASGGSFSAQRGTTGPERRLG